MTLSHWFEQLCAGDLPYIFDLICYWNYHSNLISSLFINQLFVAAITLIQCKFSLNESFKAPTARIASKPQQRLELRSSKLQQTNKQFSFYQKRFIHSVIIKFYDMFFSQNKKKTYIRNQISAINAS